MMILIMILNKEPKLELNGGSSTIDEAPSDRSSFKRRSRKMHQDKIKTMRSVCDKYKGDRNR